MQFNNDGYFFYGEESFNRFTHKLRQVLKLKQFEKNRQSLFGMLSVREKEVLTLVTRGINNPGIAKKLKISRYTVQNHRKHINKKLHIRHYRDLYKYAWAFRLISFGTD